MSTSSFNFTQPSYTIFVYNVFGTLVKSWDELDRNDKLPTEWLRLIRDYGRVTLNDIALTLILAVVWTLLRHLVTSFIFKVNSIGSDHFTGKF